jgi:hypothetical protein
VVAYLRCKTEVEVVTLNAKAWVVGPLVLCAILVSVGASEQRDTLATQRISIASDGAEANGGSLEEAPALSADARFIAFSSDGDNLSEGDRGSDRDVFVRDRRTGITERISVSRDGAEAEGHSSGPAISGDGQIIVFTSGAPNLVSGDTNAATDVFLRDRVTGSTERVSVASNGDQANGGSYGAAVSDDGRFVAFVSLASDLVPGDTNAVADVFVHDRQTRAITRMSRSSAGAQGNAESGPKPGISADGRYVAFTSAADNLVEGDSNAVPDVFVHDRVTGETVRASVANDGAQADAGSRGIPAMSADGRLVAFVSRASNLVPGDTNSLDDVFVRDLRSGKTERVSVRSDGTQAMLEGARDAPAISADGRYVAFVTRSADLVQGDTNGTEDIFVHDRETGATHRASVASDGRQASGTSFAPALSARGGVVAFASQSADLVAEDRNGRTDVFVHQRVQDPRSGTVATAPDSPKHRADRDAGESSPLAGELGASADEPPTFAGGYRTIATIYAQMASIAVAYPGITQLVDYGDSYSKTVGGVTTPGGDFIAGYDLKAMKVTNRSTPGPKPRFVLIGETHARELSPSEIAMRMLEWLVSGYGNDADASWLIDAHEIWIVPLVNPDGRWYVELGTKPPYNGAPFQWRKNGNPSAGGGAWPPTSSSHYGVDLNRNSTFRWGGAGTSTNPSAWNYRGSAAGSEPETAAMETLLRSLFPDQRGSALTDPAPDSATGILVSLHTAYSLVLWPWSYTTSASAPNATGLSAIGRKLATFNGYRAGQWSTTMYVSSGTIDDWLYGELGVPAFTIEMGTHAPTMSGLNTVWSKNRGALVYAAKIARTPYMTARGPEVQSVSANASAGVLAVSATVSDAGNGGDPIAAAEFYIDTPPWRSGAAAHALSPADGAFDTATESASGQLGISGLSGRHTLYARARDAQGNWGSISATFFSPQASVDPIGSWSFDEATGTTAFDSSSTRSDAVLLNGTAWASGHAGTALDFDGTNDIVKVSGSDSFDTLGAVTVSAWIYPRSAGEAGKGRIVDKANGVTPTNGWLLHVSGNGTQLSFLADYSSTNLARHAAANSIALNAWQHVTVTWDGGASASGVHIYVNGREVSYATSTSGTGSRVNDALEELKIGNDKSAARTFDGRIDEVRVWGRALSASEVAAMAQSSTIGVWSFDEGSGTTAADSSSTGSDLTLVNGTAWVPGRSGTAIRFDGVNDLARAVGSNAFDSLSAVTVSAWIRPSSGGEAGKGRIVDKANSVTPTNGWIFYLSANGTGLSFLADYSSTNLARSAAAGSIAMDTWQHVALTWDGGASASGVRMYVNGAEVAYSSSVNGTGSRVTDALEELKIGNDKSTARTFNGAIDEVRVWNRVLSPAEIAALAQ